MRTGTPGGDTYIIAGSYTDTLARTPSGWKIAERVQVYLWREGNRAVVAVDALAAQPRDTRRRVVFAHGSRGSDLACASVTNLPSPV